MTTLKSTCHRLKVTHAAVLAAALLLLSAGLLTGCNTTPRTNRSAAASDDFEKAANRPPTSKTLYVMARILSGQGRDGEAEYILVRIIREDPAYVPAYCALADLQIRSHQLDAGVKTLNAGLVQAPRDPVLLNNLGMCRVARADYAAALDFFTRAAQSDPSTPRYAANRAMALGMLGQYDEALAAYAQLVSPADAHYNLAVLCEARGDRERAASEYATADTLRAKEKAAKNTPHNAAPPGATASPGKPNMPAPMQKSSDHAAGSAAEAHDPESMDDDP